MPAAASRSRLGVLMPVPFEAGLRSSICTEVLVQPAPSPRMRTKFGCLPGAAAFDDGMDGERIASAVTPAANHRTDVKSSEVCFTSQLMMVDASVSSGKSMREEICNSSCSWFRGHRAI